MWVIDALALCVVVILLLAFFLKLFGASTDAAFTRWANRSAQSAMPPSRGISPTHQLDDGFSFDPSLLFGAICCTVAAIIADDVLHLVTKRLDLRGGFEIAEARVRCRQRPLAGRDAGGAVSARAALELAAQQAARACEAAQQAAAAQDYAHQQVAAAPAVAAQQAAAQQIAAHAARRAAAPITPQPATPPRPLLRPPRRHHQEHPNEILVRLSLGGSRLRRSGRPRGVRQRLAWTAPATPRRRPCG